ncbi:tRNA (cytosine(72)-C(5))-methyltransferase NSUN6 [Adelges cooleyi]|uniref:tRNA (cytosine(72)-C(5))-methyltransferase NSUN6 n=1 Tax=Adelges cooleyi TaxID=133065 RepID=UPI00217F743E|nr:tRNA (cytosine(72)-C(5))-methyltransferase NSUN6 [Adelges cooleyi]
MIRQAHVVRPHCFDDYFLNLLKNIYINRNISVEEATRWISSPPTNTYFRVNTLVTTPSDVVSSINEQLLKLKRVKCDEDKPLIKIHKDLDDCIVISPLKQSLLDCNPKNEEIIVDIVTGQSVLRGSHVFAPGVMGMTPDIKIDSTISVYADLAKKCKRGYQKHYDNPLKMYVGNGIMKMDRKQLFGGDMNPKGIAVEVTDSISGIPGFTLPATDGLLQNFPSIVASYALDLNGNDNLKVLDMCAAPGNKTSHIATLMKNQGCIDAVDKSKTKLKKIHKKCEEFGLENVRVHHFDSLILVDVNKRNSSTNKPPFQSESFDRVLLDAPCSNLGQRPLLKIETNENLVKSFHVLQRKLFGNAVELLKPGGILVYSTCTITPEENEQNVAWALEKFAQLELVAINPVAGAPGLPNFGLSDMNCELVQRFGPDNVENDSIGFFIAKFRKK